MRGLSTAGYLAWLWLFWAGQFAQAVKRESQRFALRGDAAQGSTDVMVGTLGLEGMDETEQSKCMRDKATRPTGQLDSYLGTKLPSKLEVQSIDTAPALKGAICDNANDRKGNCGLFQYSHPNPEESQDCVREVPKLIHFIWLDKPLPQKYAENILSVMKVNSDYQFLLWVNEAAEDVSNLTEAMAGARSEASLLQRNSLPKLHVKHLREHRDKLENWDIIAKEPNVGARSDWIRLEVVHQYGGIYMDTDAKPNHPFSQYGGIFRWPFVASSDPKGYGNLCNCVFGAEKHSPLLRLASKGWREANLNYDVPSGPPFGCGVLTGAFLTHNNPEILMLPEQYVFKKKGGVDPVMFMTFDGSWIDK